MDDPSLEVQRHIQALRGLERINHLSGSVRTLWPSILTLAKEAGVDSLRVLDIATGAGDVPIELWKKAQGTGLRLEIDGCDRSRTAVEYARRRAQQARVVHVQFFELDVLGGALPPGYDIVTCSLFLHHLDPDEVVSLLREMAQKAGRMVLVSDLVRSTPALVLAYLGTRLLSASDVVHTDGPRSVWAAYTLAEVLAFTKKSGLNGTTISSRWPYRFLLTWKKQ